MIIHKRLHRPNLADYAIMLGCIALFLMGLGTIFLAGIPAAFYIDTSEVALGQIMGEVNTRKPIVNVFLTNLGTAQLELQGFTTNDVPVTLRIFCFNSSLSSPLVYEATTLMRESQIRVAVHGDATIQVAYEESDALFIYWLIKIEYIPRFVNTVAIT